MDILTTLSAYKYQVIETLAVFIIYITVRFSINFTVRRRMIAQSFGQSRMLLVRKVLRIIAFIIFAIIVSSIWGVKQGDILLFLTSLLTVIGIGFFAQWSILSNVTAGLILFFGNDIRLGTEITIFEKDLDITGTVEEIGLVFFLIKTKERGLVSIPNTLILQKMVALPEHSRKE